MQQNYLSKKREEFKKSIRRSDMDEHLKLKRETFIKKMQTNPVVIPNSQENKSQLNAQLIKEIEQTQDNNSSQMLDRILNHQADVLNNSQVIAYIQQVFNQERNPEVVDKVKNILLKYVTNPNRYLESQKVYNILQLLLYPEFLDIWEWISSGVKDYDVKRTCIKYFQILLTQTSSIINQKNISFVLNILQQFLEDPQPILANIIFYFAIIIRILSECKVQTEEYISIIKILQKLSRDHHNIKYMITNSQLLYLIGKEIRCRTKSCEISISLRLLCRFFYHEEKIANTIDHLLEGMIDVVLNFLLNAHKEEIQVLCLHVLCNMVANNPLNIGYLLRNRFIPFIQELSSKSRIKVRSQVVKILYGITLKMEECDYRYFVAQFQRIFRMVILFLDETDTNNVHICLKTVESIFQIIRSMEGVLITKEQEYINHILCSLQVQKKIEGYLAHKSKQIRCIAQNILSQFSDSN